MPKSALEAANLNEDLPADMDGLIEQAEDDALERSAIEGELERLRGEMTQAVASAPHLVGQIASGADAETSVGRYVDEHLGLIVRRAPGYFPHGHPHVRHAFPRFLAGAAEGRTGAHGHAGGS